MALKETDDGKFIVLRNYRSGNVRGLLLRGFNADSVAYHVVVLEKCNVPLRKGHRPFQIVGGDFIREFRPADLPRLAYVVFRLRFHTWGKRIHR